MCPPTDESPSYLLQLKNGQIPVYRKGNGKQLLITLHGFESDGELFSKWEESLGGVYTICAPDLPFHGKADWKKTSFNRTDILELIQAIIKKEQAIHITLVGFSMGARLIICLGEKLKNQIKQFIFLAPAGIGSYDKVPPLFFQRIAEWSLKWPGWFKFGVNLFFKFGWINPFHKRYAEVQIFPNDRRYRLFRVFNSVLDFQTSTSILVNFWQKSTIPTLIILASRDRMVPNDKIKAYFAKHPNCKAIEVDDKHEMDMGSVGRIMREQYLR